MTVKPKREKRIEIRLNDLEYKVLKAYAENRGVSVAESIRDWVKNLPHQ